MSPVFTVGHSTHTIERFVTLLQFHEISAIADVRSNPYSRACPQFNRESLKSDLRDAGIAYVYLGKELGARTEDPACYENGRVQYGRLAETKPFRLGMDRVLAGSQAHRLALMCAEKEPLECHRTLLVARQLAARGIPVVHILATGRLERHEELLERLCLSLHLPESDMFRSHEDVLEDAYRIQEARVAYTIPQ